MPYECTQCNVCTVNKCMSDNNGACHVRGCMWDITCQCEGLSIGETGRPFDCIIAGATIICANKSIVIKNPNGLQWICSKLAENSARNPGVFVVFINCTNCANKCGKSATHMLFSHAVTHSNVCCCYVVFRCCCRFSMDTPSVSPPCRWFHWFPGIDSLFSLIPPAFQLFMNIYLLYSRKYLSNFIRYCSSLKTNKLWKFFLDQTWWMIMDQVLLNDIKWKL